MPIIRVALDVPLSTLFDYLVTGEQSVEIGQRVLVSFRRRPMVGVVMELAAASEITSDRIKPVEKIFTDVPPLSFELLKLLKFCSDYYHYPLGMTVMAALPVRLRSDAPIELKQSVWYGLTEQGRALNLAELPKRRAVQRNLLTALGNANLSEAQLRAISSTAKAQIKAMVEAGWVAPYFEKNSAESSRLTFNPVHALTAAQQEIVDAVAKSEHFRCFLLHGITGSGKTEVYVHLMQQALQQGGQVLLLVPEINLTPQLENYFRTRFPETEMVSLHSGMADGERAQYWLKAQSGHARIVLGTRLSVFTPLPQLKLILVDEEHDTSYKQQDGLRYSARDVAIFRANQHGIPIVLGSATPSLESYHNAKTGRYVLETLTQRATEQAELPQVRCINTSQIQLQEGLSDQMLGAIKARLERKEQSLVFINRRGYAPVLMCTACGWLSGCSCCAGKMVLHLKDKRLHCHHCGNQQRVPPACPSCGNADLQPVGLGTQRIEEALQAHFPDAKILRVDRDSTRHKGSWVAMRKQIEDCAVDILIGTQILAKGHDFPNLTLVGVLNPDGALYSADFRASERLFAQLAQVAGRAGRADKAGEVLIQTAFPDHPLFRALRAHDYDLWANTLLEERASAGFPPYVYQALLRAEDRSEHETHTFLKLAREKAKACADEVEIYGVVAAAMPKRANHYHAQLLVQSATRKTLQKFLRTWYEQLREIPAKKIRWSLDVDPIEF